MDGTATKRDLSRRGRTETTDAWYSFTDIETTGDVSQEVKSRRSGGTERDDPAPDVDFPGDDRDLWYTLSVESEGSES